MISSILVLGCLSALAPVWCVTPLSRFAIDEQFNYFIQHHNKVYHDFQEREYRYNIFMENLQRLNEMGRFHHHHPFGNLFLLVLKIPAEVGVPLNFFLRL